MNQSCFYVRFPFFFVVGSSAGNMSSFFSLSKRMLSLTLNEILSVNVIFSYIFLISVLLSNSF